MPLTLIHSKQILSPHSLTFNTMAAFQFPDPAVQDLVQNPITGSTYRWKADPGKWVITAQSTSASDFIWEGPNPPLLAPGDDSDYKLWYNTDTLELYFYYCDVNGSCAWVPTAKPLSIIEDLDNSVFELRSDLIQTNVAVRENENRIGRTIEFSDTAPTIFPDEVIETPIYDVDGITQIDTQIDTFPSELNYKFWYDTARLELLVLFRDADGDDSYVPVSIPLTDIDLEALNTQVQANSYSNNQQSQAIVTLEEMIVRNFEEHQEIKNEIIELEEEIDAIAPSNERGEWTFNPVGVASPGYYAFLDSSTQPTDRFDGAAIIYVSTRDADNTTHSFNNHEVGEYLQIFNKEGGGYGLYQITDIDDNSNGNNPFFAFTVDFVQSLVTAPKAEGRGRFKFFTIADADPGAYVLKTGDKMTGNLQISTEDEFGAASLKLSGYRDNNSNSAATIAFENTNSGATGADIGYITFYHIGDVSTARFGFNRDIDLKSNDITEVSNLKLTNPGSIWSATNERIKFKTASNGNDGSGLVEFQRPGSNSRRGFVIRGKNTSNADADLLFSFTNSSGGDSVDYVGKQNDNSNHLATTKYVKNYIDNNVLKNVVEDFSPGQNWNHIAGVYINGYGHSKVNNPTGDPDINKHTYTLLVSSSGYGSFYVIGNDACVRNDMYVRSHAENDNPKGQRVATVSNSRSMMSGMRQAILGAVDFDDLKSRLLNKLEELENSDEFSEEGVQE